MTTELHEQLRRTVRDFADEEVAPRIAAMERDQGVDRELASLIAAQGWIGVTIDPRWGGMGAGHEAKTIIVEELSRVSAAAGAIAQASQLGVAKIALFGSEEQQRTWLPAIASGSVLPTIAVTEAGSGGHVLGIRSTARRSGSHYVLNGRKCFVGNSHVGGLHGVVVRTSAGSRGLTAFLVEADRPGVTLEPHRPRLGLRGFSFGTIRFDEVKVPASAIAGEVGDGLAVAYSSSTLYGRANLAAVALGVHHAAVARVVDEAATRVRYSKPLGDLPVIQQKLGQMQARLESARALAYAAVAQLDRGQPCDGALIASKHQAVTLLLKSVHQGMEVHAADALYADSEMARLLRDSWCIEPPAGTSDIQAHRLAMGLLHPGRHPDWSARFADKLKAHGAWAGHGAVSERPVLAVEGAAR
ncbi:acyl-CoA dehydrogenase family protein [Streptacidiphilus jiangxiensis]|uniref:Acyl-CoA dehydrogenase n=1 Tax=Streptacidiphilus jiangxiensis TaxID=235985 RepID=A0A1H8BNM0_STRJI|nr:acyl-CoA dehydrogenase [Streptacidiphilus jiangxiensis]SEM84480.1 Acyl-CoA dehydrogenase [Streptacidiphilus jiangxiensis]